MALKSLRNACGIGSVLLLVAGCGPQFCRLERCSSALALTVQRADRQPLTSYRGTLTIDEQRHAFTCADPEQCPDLTKPLRFSDAAKEDAVYHLEISDDKGAQFSGTLNPRLTVEENFNGPGCGECIRGTAAVELR